MGNQRAAVWTCILIFGLLPACSSRSGGESAASAGWPPLMVDAGLSIQCRRIAYVPGIGEITDLRTAADGKSLLVAGSLGTAKVDSTQGTVIEKHVLDRLPDALWNEHALVDLKGDSKMEVLVVSRWQPIDRIVAYDFEGQRLWVCDPDWPKKDRYCGHIYRSWWVQTDRGRAEGVHWATCNDDAVVIDADGKMVRRVPWGRVTGEGVSFIADFDGDGNEDVCYGMEDDKRRLAARDAHGRAVFIADMPRNEYVNTLYATAIDGESIIRGVADGAPPVARSVPDNTYKFVYDRKTKAVTFTESPKSIRASAVVGEVRLGDSKQWLWRVYSLGGSGVMTAEVVSDTGELAATHSIPLCEGDRVPQGQGVIQVLKSPDGPNRVLIGWGSGIWEVAVKNSSAK